MGLFDFLKPADPAAQEEAQRAEARRADISSSLQRGQVPATARARLEAARDGRLPWTATLTPAELRVARSHGLRPVAAVSATCWMHYGWSWTEGHAQGWAATLRRLRDEAVAAGANAVLDVKMRTVPLAVEDSMDFTLLGTAVRVEGLPPSQQPIVATVPALEFCKLIEADVVPTGIAVGARYDWMQDWRGTARQAWMGNVEAQAFSQFWMQVRRQAQDDLRRSAQGQGNGVLAHVNFSQLFEVEGEPKRYLGRHIVIATTVDARRGASFPHDIGMAVDVRAGPTPLKNNRPHHQAYASNEREGGV
jgi:hypothetical protein